MIRVLVLASAVLFAADDDISSGPEKGAKPSGFKAHAAIGDDGKEVDPVKDAKDGLSVYLFVASDKFERPMFRFMKELDKAGAKDFEKASFVAVWLTDDAKKSKEYLPKIKGYFDKTTLATFDGKDGPKGWNVNADAFLTVVVANKGKVVKTFAYKSVNDTEVPAVVKAIKAAK